MSYVVPTKKKPVDERDEFEALLADEGIKTPAGPSYKYVAPAGV